MGVILMKCPKCKKHFITVMGGKTNRFCRCDNPKMYDVIKGSFELAFKEGSNEKRKRHTKRN